MTSTLVIDSRLRGSQPNTSHFFCSPQVNRGRKIVGCKVLQVIYTNSFYNIEGNVNLYLSIAGGAMQRVNFPPGHYDNLASINAVLTAAIAAMSVTQTATQMRDGTCSMVNATPDPFVIGNPFTYPDSIPILQILGFWPRSYEATRALNTAPLANISMVPFITAATTQVSSLVMETSIHDYFLVNLGFLNGRGSISSADSSSDVAPRMTNVAVQVPLNPQFMSLTCYTPPNLDLPVEMGSLDRMDVAITDWKGDILNLHGSEWSIILQLTFSG